MMANFIEFAKKAMLPYSPGILMAVMKCKGLDSQDSTYKGKSFRISVFQF